MDGHFRGGRSTEVTYLLDGVRTDDTYGQTDQTVYLEPSVLKDLPSDLFKVISALLFV